MEEASGSQCIRGSISALAPTVRGSAVVLGGARAIKWTAPAQRRCQQGSFRPTSCARLLRRRAQQRGHRFGRAHRRAAVRAREGHACVLHRTAGGSVGQQITRAGHARRHVRHAPRRAAVFFISPQNQHPDDPPDHQSLFRSRRRYIPGRSARRELRLPGCQ